MDTLISACEQGMCDEDGPVYSSLLFMCLRGLAFCTLVVVVIHVLLMHLRILDVPLFY